MDQVETRKIIQHITAVLSSDGAGVKLWRSLGSQHGLYSDTFLMLDEFGSERADDYIAGFPAHPHRGFETVTYMLNGRMQHCDHLGNVGDIGPGDVQWMCAGRGVIHSEMPMQESGLMRGFQLWINLPASEKMRPASYRDIAAHEIPALTLSNGVFLKVIAGSLQLGEYYVQGPINADERPVGSDPLYVDVHLPEGACFEQAVPDDYNTVLYCYEGRVQVGLADAGQWLSQRQAALLSSQGRVSVQAGESAAKLLLLAAKPLREPVVQYGPFVMNSRQEIEQAIRDYQHGVLV